jgi:hypothetical protein
VEVGSDDGAGVGVHVGFCVDAVVGVLVGVTEGLHYKATALHREKVYPTFLPNRRLFRGPLRGLSRGH